MNKKLVLLMIAVILLQNMMHPVRVNAEEYAAITGGTARVIQIIDSDAIKVQMTDTKKVALIKLVGVSSGAGKDALTYLTNSLLGTTVRMTVDSNITTGFEDRWNYMYVYSGNVMINTEIISKGYAKVNNDHSGASMYASLAGAQTTATASKLGVWQQTGITTSENVTTTVTSSVVIDVLNINTATAEQIKSIGFTESMANYIISYRTSTPFKNLSALKSVNGFTSIMYETYKNRLTVCTNINKASASELGTLIDITAAEATAIVESRKTKAFTTVTELVTRNLISQIKFNTNFRFTSVTDVTELTLAETNYKTNINTASKTQLMATGLTDTQADAIVSGRSWYTYKNIGEFDSFASMNTSGAGLTTVLNKYSTYTDINNATLPELQTLFGDSTAGEAATVYNARPYTQLIELQSKLSTETYAKIVPYIYLNGMSVEKLNLNIATVDQMMKIGIPQAQAESVYKKTRSMKQGKDIPENLTAFDRYVTLYTNLNKASVNELMGLSPSFDAGFATQLMSYRAVMPFANTDQVKQYFIKNEKSALYDEIKDFIVLA